MKQPDSNSPPMISVIIAAYNCVRTLQACISSFTAQTHPCKELIIIDGGSSDGTVEILDKNSAVISYRESRPDRGICHAWNKGVRHAKGDWICFLGADDYLWSPDTLSLVAPYLKKAGRDVRIAYGPVITVKEDGTTIMKYGQPWQRRQFLQLMPFSHQGTFHRRSFFDIHGYFDESFRIGGDYEILLRELKTSDPLFIPDVIIAGMRYGGLSSDAQYSLKALGDIVRARKKHGIKDLPLLLYWTCFKAWVRWQLTQIIGNSNMQHIANLYRKLTGRPPI